MTTKYCIRCKKDKSLDSFGYNKKHKDKRQTYCQVCVSEIGFIRNLDPKIKKQVAKNHTIIFITCKRSNIFGIFLIYVSMSNHQ